jgi:hypothetical protein
MVKLRPRSSHGGASFCQFYRSRRTPRGRLALDPRFGPGCCSWSLRSHRQDAGARKTDSQSVGFSLNGTHLSLAKLHVTHSKDKRGSENGFRILSNLFILNNMAERVGFEPTLPFRVNTLSKRAPSATRPSLRRGCCDGKQTFRSEREPDGIHLQCPRTSISILWSAAQNRKPLSPSTKI